MDELPKILFLGVLEGLTEFIPVSSTGHLILFVELLGANLPEGKVFEVVIQLGAILAVCVVYFSRLWGVTTGLLRLCWATLFPLPSLRAKVGDDRRPASAVIVGRVDTSHRDLEQHQAALRFAVAVILAFLPAAIIGVLAHETIKTVLFDPTVVCVALIVGGVLILVTEKLVPEPRHHAIEGFSAWLALRIGLFQCLAMIPGVSRSGATIIGALLMGVERKTAMEFSFFLAIPTMLGATVYDLYKNWDTLDTSGGFVIAIGFAAAFLAAALVVRGVLSLIARYGFAPFAWYRIALGTGMLALLYG